jgi:hypothetical protein
MPTPSLPRSLADLLAGARPCFTAPTFRVFQAMVCGLIAQPGLRTITGMLAGARLAGVWHHARAHRFFAAARWSADQLGLAAYAGKTLRGLPARVSVTTRLRSDAALHALPGPRRPGQRGRPRVKGERLPELIVLAALVKVRWQPATVCCYGTRRTVALASLVCLWPTVFGAQPVQVVLVRSPGAPDGYDLALVSPIAKATPAELVERYAARWNVEVLFEEARQVAGVGQARNRVRKAVERTVPFGLLCVSLVVVWYALHGQPALDVAAHRARAPWYRHKHVCNTCSPAPTAIASRPSLADSAAHAGRPTDLFNALTRLAHPASTRLVYCP